MSSTAIQISQYLDMVYGSLLNPDENYGQISRYEAEFLMKRVIDQKPRCILEIGTASGSSAAHMLSAQKISGIPSELHTLEYLDHCYFDKTKVPGFLVEKIFGHVPTNFFLHMQSSASDLEKFVEVNSVDFLFVDGNHSHPWAVIDLLLTLPFLSEYATIVFHDINLHLLGGENKIKDKGPHYAFYYLRAFNKIAVALRPYPNIGSLEIMGNKMQVVENLLDILFRFEWENHSWPILDQTVLDSLFSHINKWWGNSLAERYIVELKKVITKQ